ncbi:MAG: hypothetical protein LUC37_02005 [Prevotella sp.]|nr:hypothetical protein [Prevotella sp.]
MLADISGSIPSQVVSSIVTTSSSNILTISPSSKSNGDVTISVGISDSNLKSWLDSNGYGGSEPTTSGVSSVKITSSSLTVTPSSAQSGDVVINLEYTGGGDVDLSNYYTKSEIDEKLDQI